MRIVKIIFISIILTVSFSKIYCQNKKVFRFKINKICISLKDTDSCFFVCKNPDSVLIGKEILIDLEKDFIIVPSKDNITIGHTNINNYFQQTPTFINNNNIEESKSH